MAAVFDKTFRSKDSRNVDASDMYNVRDWHVFTWKIPNLSLIPHEVDFAVQSPLLYFESASWVIKMYLYGQKQYGTENNIDVIIERLNSQIPRHHVICKMYCKDDCNEEFNNKNLTFHFDSQWTYSRVHRFMCSPETSGLNDSFTLVFEFGNAVSELDLQSKSVQFAIDKQDTVNSCGRNPEIGEIFKKYLAFKTFGWKLHSLPATAPANYYCPSPQFSFANASWVLKVFSSCKEHSGSQNFRVVLERLHSEISEQNIMLDISSTPVDANVCRFFLFNSSQTTEELLHFSSIYLGFHLIVDMKIMNPDVETGYGSISRPVGVLRNFKNLFLSQEDSDVVINVKRIRFPAHRLILKAQSPVLAAALRNDMQEKLTGIIDIEDCDPSIFADFLCFLYCGEVRKLSVENAFSLLTVADKYGVMELRSMCMEFIKLNLSIDTFCDTIALAMLLSDSQFELVALSTDFLAKNEQGIIGTDKWKSFAVQNPELCKELLINAKRSNV